MSLSALLFTALFVTGCLYALARHPIYGLMTYVLIFYISPVDRWWGQGLVGDVRWSLVSATITLLAILRHKTTEPRVPILQQGFLQAYLLFVAWIAIMSFWALSLESHLAVLEIYLKYILAIVLVYLAVDTEEHLKLFLWAHVIGCGYLGWVAYTAFQGGRFNDFGGAGIGDANSSALTLVTGILAGGSLFLMADWRGKLALLAIMPIVVNALVATVSRSAFLAFVTGGMVFLLLSPKIYRKWVAATAVAGLALFVMLTNPEYWARIGTIKMMGDEVEAVDTGHKRLVLIQAQFRMFKSHPLGCGARCTDVLSPHYLDESQLAGRTGQDKVRSSHNTFMTSLVEYGVPGAVFYLLMVKWIATGVLRARGALRTYEGSLTLMLAAVGSILAAMTVADMFVQYPKLEIRFWFLTLLMILLSMTAKLKVDQTTR